MDVAPAAVNPHDHVVQVYGEEGELVEDVSRFLAEGLAADEAVIVIATPAHRDAFLRRVGEYGVDVAAACDAGRYRSLDAAEVLSSFNADGALSQELFVEVIGGVVAAAGSGGRPVRAYGEMVALLWACDDVVGAVQLEAFWNELMRSHRFLLYCAYQVEDLARGADLVAIQRVCAQHSSVVGPTTYGSSGTTAEHASRDEDATTPEFSELYIPVPSAVRAARRFVVDRLRTWGEQVVLDDAAIVVSELAANAVTHARSAFRVSIERAGATVRMAVEDLSPDRPVLDGSHRASAGRGLVLVHAICSRWGVETGPHGKRVWAEIAAPLEDATS
jgi:MEDS: MEthanogen/methylotroph, DcmR Sensory domain/Histidine kinase-like ATPase domain